METQEEEREKIEIGVIRPPDVTRLQMTKRSTA